MQGQELLQILKESKKETHVLIIAAKESLEDKLEGRDLGADG